jgi:hypothetical protein
MFQWFDTWWSCIASPTRQPHVRKITLNEMRKWRVADDNSMTNTVYYAMSKSEARAQLKKQIGKIPFGTVLQEIR